MRTLQSSRLYSFEPPLNPLPPLITGDGGVFGWKKRGMANQRNHVLVLSYLVYIRRKSRSGIKLFGMHHLHENCVFAQMGTDTLAFSSLALAVGLHRAKQLIGRVEKMFYQLTIPFPKH